MLSTGSPSRLKIRPKVSSPTGTVMDPPVSTASSPLVKPSVELIEIQRTVSSPMCCATSTTTVFPSFSMCMALRKMCIRDSPLSVLLKTKLPLWKAAWALSVPLPAKRPICWQSSISAPPETASSAPPPVSYTLLDVYKRQVSTRSWTSPISPKSPSFTSASPECMSTSGSPTAVSYTHLEC